MEKDRLLNLFCTFLSSIGIEVIEKEIEGTTFLPGLKIENGKLVVDRQKLLYPGDMLHEAGHIAVVEAAERSALNDNVTDSHPGKEGYEIAVLLWSYAVCVHLNIDPGIVFHKDGYKGDSAWLLENYRNKSFVGLPLLVWMGMTPAQNDPDGFPRMLKWVRD